MHNAPPPPLWCMRWWTLDGNWKWKWFNNNASAVAEGKAVQRQQEVISWWPKWWRWRCTFVISRTLLYLILLQFKHNLFTVCAEIYWNIVNWLLALAIRGAVFLCPGWWMAFFFLFSYTFTSSFLSLSLSCRRRRLLCVFTYFSSIFCYFTSFLCRPLNFFIAFSHLFSLTCIFYLFLFIE